MIADHWVPKGVRTEHTHTQKKTLAAQFFLANWFVTRYRLTFVCVFQKAEVYTSGWSLTHDARNFHEPFSFKPERWLDPSNADVKEASQPFSLGPRGCLGRK